jgi:hypothetical protein
VAPVRTLDDFLKLMATEYEYDSSRLARRQEALAGLNAAELEALVREFDALRKSCSPRVRWLYSSTIEPVMRRWMVLAPLPALAYAVEHGHLRSSDILPVGVGALKTAFLSAPEDAGLLRIVSKLEFRERGQIRSAYFQSLESVPPEEALPKIFAFDVRMESESETLKSAREPLRRWVECDPQGAMAWALAQPPSMIRRGILYEIIAAWGQWDEAAARASLDAIPLTVMPAGPVRENMERSLRNAARNKAP